MPRIPVIWRAGTIVFISSFCVMVIELIAARILAPYIGVSLYTWTSIIGVILAGITLGNYLGGRLADKFPSYLSLAVIFLAGGLTTMAVLPMLRVVALNDWFGGLPLMWDFVLKSAFIFFLPALILSTVSPLVIKLTLADLGKTGGIVGTLYATSTAGAILGTFLTGFFLILWFGTRTIVLIISSVLILLGLAVWLGRRSRGKWKISRNNLLLWLFIFIVLAASVTIGLLRKNWQIAMTRESNYYSIRVSDYRGDVKQLVLDNLVHGYVDPGRPYDLIYDYERIFRDIVTYQFQDSPAPRVLHLGGGTYTFSRFMQYRYPDSVNDVVEIDPVVTEVAYEYLGLPENTPINTINRDARIYLIKRLPEEKYDLVIGDVFNDRSTPYHLTTLEFDRLVKSHMADGGIYMINIIDSFSYGEYMPAFIRTLSQVFRNVYLFYLGENWKETRFSTFVIMATDNDDNLASYMRSGQEDFRPLAGIILDREQLDAYLAERQPMLLVDDKVPSDILITRWYR